MTPPARAHLFGLLILTSFSAASGQEPSLRDETLAHGPFATMHALLEKSIFNFDIVTVDIRLSPGLQARLESLLAGRDRTSALADSAAGLTVDARDVWVRVLFKRGISLDQFVDAGRKNARRAHEAGFISERTFSEVYYNLPVWYDFLRERRIEKGDEMHYRIRGDSLRTVYCGVGGEVFLDQLDIGAERRLSVMGGYFAPRSDFREDLLESLWTREGEPQDPRVPCV